MLSVVFPSSDAVGIDACIDLVVTECMHRAFVLLGTETGGIVGQSEKIQYAGDACFGCANQLLQSDFIQAHAQSLVDHS